MRHPFAAGSINPGSDVATGYELDPFGSPPRMFARQLRERKGKRPAAILEPRETALQMAERAQLAMAGLA